MEIIIRQEAPEDFPAVFNLIQNAFENMLHSDHKEQFLVERLRSSAAFIPELSLVAEVDHEIAGYILLTRITIKNDASETVSLALAPVAVLQKFQGKGIGAALINTAHQIARDMSFGSVVLLGHASYYPKFGYKIAADFGIRLPFEVPAENCMVIELTEDSLKNVSGLVEYPGEFFE